MVVTITTDASYNMTHRIGTYAYMIKCDEGLWKGSGRLKFSPGGPWEAEAGAIGNALAALIALKLRERVGQIIINTDSKEAMRHIRQNSNFDIGRAVYAQRRNTGKALKIKPKRISMRYCKAHVGGTPLAAEARHKAQQWCDSAARRVMGHWLETFIAKK